MCLWLSGKNLYIACICSEVEPNTCSGITNPTHWAGLSATKEATKDSFRIQIVPGHYICWVNCVGIFRFTRLTHLLGFTSLCQSETDSDSSSLGPTGCYLAFQDHVSCNFSSPNEKSLSQYVAGLILPDLSTETECELVKSDSFN